MDARSAHIALNMMEGIGPVTVASLTATLGSVEAIFAARSADLMSARGVGPEIADKIISQRDVLDPDKELARAGELGIDVITRLDKTYPSQLAKIHDPPLALYVKGDLGGLSKHAMAVVGTRHATHYGRDCAERLSYQLAQAGFAVVSGLARGIDTAAHKGALKAGGKTFAAMGGGLDGIYPPENAELAEDISRNGAVISEFPLGKRPDKTTFPIRNRVVSGLSVGVIVIEAGSKSGSLLTAGQALEQGRSVFAVPGRIDSPVSRGTHQLIRNGARLVECVEDIFDELEFLIPPGNGAKGGERPMPPLSADEQLLANLLCDGAAGIDELIRRSGFPAGAVSSRLIGMEMKKVVKMLPGRVVELERRVRDLLFAGATIDAANPDGDN